MKIDELKKLMVDNIILDVDYHEGEGDSSDRIAIYLSNGKSIEIAANASVYGETGYFSFEVYNKKD